MTRKPRTKLLHVVLIYYVLGNVTILAFLEFILHQSIVHPVYAIVLGLIHVMYIGLIAIIYVYIILTHESG